MNVLNLAARRAKIPGYRPRQLSAFERQIENEWPKVQEVDDLLDGWIRSAASSTDLDENATVAIIASAKNQAVNCRRRRVSPFAAVDEFRQLLITKKLDV